jgi:hypothetical protein
LRPLEQFYLGTPQHARVKTSAAKKEKNKRKYKKLKEHTKIVKMEFHKRQGTYRKGMNMDDPYGQDADVEEQQEGAKKPVAKRSKKAIGFCEYCGRSDHVTKRSKNCTDCSPRQCQEVP